MFGNCSYKIKKNYIIIINNNKIMIIYFLHIWWDATIYMYLLGMKTIYKVFLGETRANWETFRNCHITAENNS